VTDETPPQHRVADSRGGQHPAPAEVGQRRSGLDPDRRPSSHELSLRIRLILVTDPALGAPRTLMDTVAAALRAGCPAVQLRDKGAGASELLATARRLRALTDAWGALLFVNDRVDVALAAGADGVHLGPEDLTVAAARSWVGDRLMVGYSTDDPAMARKAQASGADYIGCGAVFGTSTKDVGGEAIGPERLDAVAAAVDIPVVGIGGVNADNVGRIRETRAAGCAVVGAIMAAADPERATRDILARLGD